MELSVSRRALYAVKKSIGKQTLHLCCFEMEPIGEDARKEYLSSHPGAVIDENAEKEIGEIFKQKYKEADNQYGKKNEITGIRTLRSDIFCILR